MSSIQYHQSLHRPTSLPVPDSARRMTHTSAVLSNDQNEITEQQKLAEFIRLIAEIIVDTTFATNEEQNLLKTNPKSPS